MLCAVSTHKALLHHIPTSGSILNRATTCMATLNYYSHYSWSVKWEQLCIYLSLDLFLPIILHIPFNALNPLLISYMLLPDVGIWCNRALCVETAHSTYFAATSPLVSVLFVPSLHSYYFSRKFLFFSSTYILHTYNIVS